MLHPGKRWYLPAVLALAAFAGGPLLVQARLLAPMQGFLLFALSGLLGAVSLLWGLRMVGLKEAHKATILVAVGLVPLLALGSGVYGGRKVPRINDISTDLDNPPRFVAAQDAPENAGKDLAYPEAFKDDMRAGYPDLISKTLDLPPAQGYQKVLSAARAMPGWELGRTDEAAMTLEGTQTSALFRFVDDFVVRVEPIGARSLVAMRSRSRDGKGDFGVNAARIRGFFVALDQ